MAATFGGLPARRCESCKSSPALLFCRADAAFLCGTCDARVHEANPLASRHERIWIGEQPPFLSSIDDDDDEEEESLMICDRKVLMEAGEMKLGGEYLFSDVDPYLDLEYASSMEGRFGGQNDSVVPVKPPVVMAAEIDFSKGSYSPYSTNSLGHSVSSEAGVVPEGSSSGSVADVTNPYEERATAVDREARVMRYREKRKNRRFEKTIRYASRKAYAETRPRIKGRFAKRAENETEVLQMYTSPAAVVPSF